MGLSRVNESQIVFSHNLELNFLGFRRDFNPKIHPFYGRLRVGFYGLRSYASFTFGP